jgi:hypothetical protein
MSQKKNLLTKMLRFFSKFYITVQGGKDEDKINSSIHFFIL